MLINIIIVDNDLLGFVFDTIGCHYIKICDLIDTNEFEDFYSLYFLPNASIGLVGWVLPLEIGKEKLYKILQEFGVNYEA